MNAPTPPRLSLPHGLAAAWDLDGYLRRRARRGDPFAVGFPGFPPVLFTGTADGARELFRIPAAAVRPPGPNPIEPMVGAASLILSSGARHRTDRTLLAPALHGARTKELAGVIREATLAEIESGSGATGPWRVGTTFDALSAARSITQRVILATAFGPAAGDAPGSARRADRAVEYAGAIADFLASFTTPLLAAPVLRRGPAGFGPWGRFVAARARLDRLIQGDIDRRRAVGPGDGGLLDLLLTTRYDDGSTLTDTELREQLRTLLVAGHETTATTLTWALYHLHREPGLRSRLTAELADAPTDPEEQAASPLLGALCQETLRLHPPVPMVLRTLTEPRRWRGVDLAAGQTIGLAVGVLHSQPSTWPAPRLFHPDRFLDRKIAPSDYAPFGGGHRRCIGATLAEHELRSVLAMLVTETELRLEPALALGRRPRAVPRNLATAPGRPIRFVRVA
ncbi:cytochrome P450 [Nocardia neocaledoniensis NBRC 108232]|uniref:Cytochrome P450 n=1 Tax=Nocardia neocaledoniensis TaxID=236511 RepID=A0A317NMV7_9NOCA|nr:cytochrome P450 [Nocardia neocaledoniensis]PWV76272.1 cytochrome P450 [Nocardia neocaledoniensis]GEM32232.1 cytochrome P450 [Nocardia neocaledoniensis NBRC 108232]